MIKRVFCVLLTALLALYLACAVAQTVEIGSVSFTVHDSFERSDNESGSLVYTGQNGDTVYAFVLDFRPSGPALYENSGKLIDFVTYFRDTSMPTSEIIAFDECVALYEVKEYATLVIFNRYDVICIYVDSDDDVLQQMYVNLILASASAKETPLRETVSKVYQYNDEDFTLEANQYDFKLFLPSKFKAYPDISPGYMTYILDSLTIVIESDPTPQLLEQSYYDDRDQLRTRLEQYAAINPESEVIQMDECLGLLTQQELETFDVYTITIQVTNRKNTCTLFIYSESSLDEARELAYAIIDHAVAKEIPLEELNTPTAYIPKYTDADYTQEIVYGDFHLFLPSSFESSNDIVFSLHNGDKYPQIMFLFSDTLPYDEADIAPFYEGMTSQDELRAYYEMLIDIFPEYTLIQADECYGLMESYQSDDHYTVSLDIVNLKDSIIVDIMSDSSDEALELAQGIIDHAVAKEIPLEELQ